MQARGPCPVRRRDVRSERPRRTSDRLVGRTSALAVLVACGRVDFDPGQPGASGDGPIAATFGTPTPITELNTAFVDGDPTLTGDRLEIFFTSDRPSGIGGSDIWTSVRSAIDQPWPTPTVVAAVSSTADESCPRLTRDAVTLYFESDRAVTANERIWVAKRSTRGAPWGTPTMIAELPDLASCPSVDVADTRMVFQHFTVSNDLYETTRTSTTAPWNAPVLVTSLSSAAEDATPWLSTDGLVVYFASDRPGVGNRDLYRASRPAPGTPFAVSPVTELDSTDGDSDPWLTDDERWIVFARGGTGEDLYEASR